VTIFPSFLDKILVLLHNPFLDGYFGFLLRVPFIVLSWIVYVFGILLAGILYGWYGFDFYWISDDWDPHDRYRAVENNWAYMFGFGLPYVVLVRSSGFFLGYGLYLLLFPFCIILSTLSDAEGVVRRKKDDYEDERSSVLSAIPIFEVPQMITQALLGVIDSGWAKKSVSSMRKTKFK